MRTLQIYGALLAVRTNTPAAKSLPQLPPQRSAADINNDPNFKVTAGRLSANSPS